MSIIAFAETGGSTMAKTSISRAHRLADMMKLLCQARLTSRELRYLYGVSRWTIWRDLRDLQRDPTDLPLLQDEWRRWYVLKAKS